MISFARPLRLLVASLVLPFLLTACGGGGSDNGGMFVSQMAASTLQYSRNMVITVTGSGLDKGLKVAVDAGCGEVTESAGGDALTRRFTCKVTALGPKTIRAFTANNLEAARLQVTVPEPEVTVILQGVDTTTSTFTVKLDPTLAPVSVNNFLDYVNAGFYRLTIFHRVVKDFVVQAGGYTAGAVTPVVTSQARLPCSTFLALTGSTPASKRLAKSFLPTSWRQVRNSQKPSSIILNSPEWAPRFRR